MPPSGDDLPGRRAPRRQRPAADRAAKRNRGKQPGAPGSAMTWAEPDETRDHHPQGTCECGADLGDAGDLGVARSFQQTEIPEPSARRIQHDLHLGLCGCGREHVAPRLPGVPGSPVSIGPNLRALAVYLVVFQHVPVGRCRDLIADVVAGAAVSTGFICSCQAAALAVGVIRLIRTLITTAHVAGFDETTPLSGPAGEKKYVLGAFTEKYSLFLGARSLESFRDFGILPDFGGVVVSDRYVNYFHPEWKHIAGNQACCAYLLRDYKDAAETYPDAIWPAQAQRALRGLIRAWHDACDDSQPAIPAAVADPLALEFRRAVTVGLSQVPRIPGPKHSTAQHPGRDLLEFCRNREDDVLRFTRDTRTWPTNNISERGVSLLKTQQKISGRLTSDDVTQDRLDIRTYIDTARKHGHDALAVLAASSPAAPGSHPHQPTARHNRGNPSHRISPCARGGFNMGWRAGGPSARHVPGAQRILGSSGINDPFYLSAQP
jgi:transposase